MTSPDRALIVTDLQSWLRDRVAHHAECAAETVDPSVNFAAYGLDSVYAFILCGEIEDELGVRLEPTVVWDYPTIDALVSHLDGLVAAAAAEEPGT